MAGGRIRTLKPELLEDEVVANLSVSAKWLFVSCILLADDHGNLRASPAYLQSTAFWAHPDIDVDQILGELKQTGLIEPYQVRGQGYLHLRNWKKHQKIDKPGKPKIPTLEEAEPPGLEHNSLKSNSFSVNSRTFAKIPENSRKVAMDQDLDQDLERDQDLGLRTSCVSRARGAPAESVLALVPPTAESSRNAVLGKPDSAKQRALVEKHLPQAQQVLLALNQARERVVRGAKSYKPSYTALGFIAARLDAGASIEECLHVVAAWEQEVRLNSKVATWFRHDTPFRPDKFAEKLALEVQACQTRTRPSAVKNQPSATPDQSFSEADLDQLLKEM